MSSKLISNRSTKLGMWLARLLLALLLLGVAFPTLPAQTAFANVYERPVAAPVYAIYTVQPRDTLFSIARWAGSTVPTLVAINRLDNPNQIHIGQLILIPASVEDRGNTTNYTI